MSALRLSASEKDEGRWRSGGPVRYWGLLLLQNGSQTSVGCLLYIFLPELKTDIQSVPIVCAYRWSRDR